MTLENVQIYIANKIFNNNERLNIIFLLKSSFLSFNVFHFFLFHLLIFFLKNTDIFGLFIKNSGPIFIYADQSSSISFFRVMVSNLSCQPASYFLRLFGNSIFYLLNSSFNYVDIENANFMTFANSSLVIDTVIVERIVLKTVDYGQNQTSFIESNSFIAIINSLFYSNIISDNGCLILLLSDTFSSLTINSSIFKNNKGNSSTISPFLMSIFSQSASSYCLLNNVLLFNNNGFEGIIDLQINSGFFVISNLSIDSSSINYGIHLKNLKLIQIIYFTCSNINLNDSKFSGPCLFLEDSEEITLKYLEMSNNFALSNVPGITITERNYDYTSGIFCSENIS